MEFTKEVSAEVERINAKIAALKAEILVISSELKTVEPDSHREMILIVEQDALGQESQRLFRLAGSILAACDDNPGVE